MSPLHFDTVLVFTALVMASLALGLGLLAWRDRSLHLRDWTLSLLCALLGLLGFALRTELPAWSTAVLANVLVLASGMFAWAGYARLSGRRRPWALFLLLLAAECLLSLALNALQPDPRPRILLFNLSMAALAGASLALLATQRRRGEALLLALPLLAHALLLVSALARVALLLIDPRGPTTGNAHVAVIMLSCLGLVVMGLGFIALQAGRWLADLQGLAATDPLTGLLNRRGLALAAEREWSRERRQRNCLALLALDIDHFKQINDRHGHARGDDVLRAVGLNLQSLLRPYDISARTGGEEFCVLLPGCDAEAARQTAARLLAMPLSVDGQAVTLSIGLALLCDGDGDLDALLARADAALYQAKQQGRHRVVEA